MSALESALLRGAGFRHGFSVKPLDFSPDHGEVGASEDAIALLLRLPRRRMYRASQVHGTRVIVANGEAEAVAREQADALVAKEPEMAVGVRTADCVPVLLASSKTGIVAAVHAGWRGIVGGVVHSAFAAGTLNGELDPLTREPCNFDLAAIGPCIGVCCFDVGEDVAEKLGPHVRRADGRTTGDLRAAVRAQLVACGVAPARIDDVTGCTRCDAARFFSHRRDGEAAGRHLAIIAVRV